MTSDVSDAVWKNFGKVDNETFCQALVYMEIFETIPFFRGCTPGKTSKVLSFTYDDGIDHMEILLNEKGKVLLTDEVNEAMNRIMDRYTQSQKGAMK
jgi:hypothetical protein